MGLFQWLGSLIFHKPPVPVPVPTPVPVPKPVPVPNFNPVPTNLIDEVFNEINLFRASIGRSVLNNDGGLTYQAQKHSYDMARELRIDHDGFAGRIQAVHPNTRSAENVEYNRFTTAAEIVRQWVNSPAHLTNMSGNYDLMGIGAATGSDGNDYWTTIFDNF